MLKLNKKIHIFNLVIFILFNCELKNDEKNNYARIAEKCKQKKTIKELPISFIGYSHSEISEITVKILHNENSSTVKLQVPEKITDSIRLKRDVILHKIISLTDTICLILPNKERYFISDFKYKLRPHFTSLSKDWSCDFYEMKINNIVEEGGTATFIKKGYNIKI